MFIAAGHDGLRLTSPEGRVWPEAQLGKEGETYGCAVGGGGRVVIAGRFGGNNLVAASHDGRLWETRQFDAKYVRYIRGLGHATGGSFGEGTFIAVGGDPGSVGAAKPFSRLSPDGLTWGEAHEDSTAKFILRRLAFGNGLLAGVGDRGRRAVSTDGVHWTDAPDAKARDTLIDIAFGADAGGTGRFVGVGLHGLRMTSTDGLAWSERQTGPEGEHLNSVVWTGDRFVAVGQGATYLSADGIAWDRLPNTNVPTTACHGGGVFVGAAWKGRLFRSTDGVVWEETHRAERHIETVAFAELAG